MRQLRRAYQYQQDNPDPAMQWVESPQHTLTPEQYLAIKNDPTLLTGFDKKFKKLVKLVYQFRNEHHAKLLKKEIRVRRMVDKRAPDPFLENLPPVDKLSRLVRGRIFLARLLFEGNLSLEIGLSGTSRNIAVVGPTGSGKSSLLRLALLCASGQAICIVFDRKGDSEIVSKFKQAGEVVVLNASQLSLALFQPPPGMSVDSFIGIMVQVLASNLSLMASRRLLSDCLYILFKRKRALGEWPTLEELVAIIHKVSGDSRSRLGQYKEALLYSLRDLLRRTGGILNYVKSNFLEQVFSDQARTFIFQVGDIPIDHLSIVISLFYLFVYESRRISGVINPPVMFFLDDALPLLTGSSMSEAEGSGMNPFAMWSFMMRAFNCGTVWSSQGFASISPALRFNTDTLICLGASGDDADAVAHHMNLNYEQAALLPLLRPGEAIVQCKSEWPLAVRGNIPLIQ